MKYTQGKLSDRPKYAKCRIDALIDHIDSFGLTLIELTVNQKGEIAFEADGKIPSDQLNHLSAQEIVSSTASTLADQPIQEI